MAMTADQVDNQYKLVHAIREDAGHFEHPTQFGLTYLCYPFCHENKQVEEARLRVGAEITKTLIGKGMTIFAPVNYSLDVQEAGAIPPQGWYHWDLGVLDRCDTLAVIEFPGWEKSLGVTLELVFARAKDMNIVFVSWDKLSEENEEFHLDPHDVQIINDNS